MQRERESPLSLPNAPGRLAVGMWWQIGAIGALAPMLPIYFSGLGVSASSIAFLSAVQAAAGLVVAQIVGWLADAKYKRTTVLLMLATGAAISQALFPFLPGSTAWLAVGVAGLALFFNQQQPIYNSLLLDSERGEELYPRVRLVGSLGFIAITLVTGRAADMPLFTAAIMWPILVFISVAFAWSLRGLVDLAPKDRHRHGQSRIGFRQAQRMLLSNPLILRFLIFIFITQFVIAPAHMMQIKLLIDLGASSFFAMACVAVASTCETITFWFGAAIMRKFKLMTLLGIVPAAIFVRTAVIFFFPNPYAILGTNVLHMISFGLSYMCAVIFINRETPRELRSSGQTMLGLVYSFVSMLLGTLASSGFLSFVDWFSNGSVGETGRLRALFGAYAVVAILGMVAWWPMKLAYDRKHFPVTGKT
ncbi:hypothetical protein BH09SUM1_BH09SUM1_18430 [soil metagenome]